ncbi:hypothetical protein WSM22_07400 [Cytophagales bacterium WSM2-2]|nr:hypothetical protein WSM22_07400 [Cytophagales bacterium WSM2-2]
MNRSKFLIYLLLLTSCVAPYDISVSEFHDALVVEGMITNQPGAYAVMISKAMPVRDQLRKTEWIKGASVTILDDLGNSEKLTEKSDGHYYTQTTQGVIGRSYTLKIATADGMLYESAVEKLLPVGDFTNMRSEFVMNEEPTYYNQKKSTNGFNIFIDSQVLPEQEERVWWRWTGTFEIFTHPELFRVPIPMAMSPPFDKPAPFSCSGYISKGQALIQTTNPCTCCECWVTEYNQVPEVSDSRHINSGLIKNLNVAFITANVRTFYKKYYIEVEQLSCSQAVYDFWKGVRVQKESSSDLFQTPPPKTRGNIYAVSVGATNVIGYFAASAVVKHTLTLNRADVPYHLNPIDTIIAPCTSAYKYSTTAKPTFW